MEYIYIGKIVGTHGIKGEIKIISDFEYKDKVFKKDKFLYIGNSYSKEIIASYRKHKNYDMVLLSDYNNINQVIPFVKQKVYILKDELNLNENEILEDDIIGISAFVNDKKVGTVTDIYKTGNSYRIIEVESNDKKILFPYHKDYISEISISDKYIKFNKEGVVNDEN